MRCDKCGSPILELWSKGKGAVWLACSKCDKTELDQMKTHKAVLDESIEPSYRHLKNILGVKD